ncbi:alpha-1,2-mannosidase [Colletotrichum higginsianum]|uniref:Alpha-1,2-mannosidase n=2 Tax=Colletotrichum higginsianum (strain IMI 349063) TaxID=759273 RepID=H1V127_COLHI|nr:alpha-1,2-mannosidase [Colletotrichum higginsianum]
MMRGVGFDAAYKNIYVRSARLYSEAYSRGWIGYGFLNQGRMLELVLVLGSRSLTGVGIVM